MARWYYEQDTREPYVVDRDGGRICTMEGSDRKAHKNAKLCAQAPRMLEIIKALLGNGEIDYAFIRDILDKLK